MNLISIPLLAYILKTTEHCSVHPIHLPDFCNFICFKLYLLGNDFSLLHFCIQLIKKDGGIRPDEVLATCAYKVLHSTRAATVVLER